MFAKSHLFNNRNGIVNPDDLSGETIGLGLSLKKLSVVDSLDGGKVLINKNAIKEKPEISLLQGKFERYDEIIPQLSEHKIKIGEDGGTRELIVFYDERKNIDLQGIVAIHEVTSNGVTENLFDKEKDFTLRQADIIIGEVVGAGREYYEKKISVDENKENGWIQDYMQKYAALKNSQSSMSAQEKGISTLEFYRELFEQESASTISALLKNHINTNQLLVFQILTAKNLSEMKQLIGDSSFNSIILDDKFLKAANLHSAGKFKVVKGEEAEKNDFYAYQDYFLKSSMEYEKTYTNYLMAGISDFGDMVMYENFTKDVKQSGDVYANILKLGEYKEEENDESVLSSAVLELRNIAKQMDSHENTVKMQGLNRLGSFVANKHSEPTRREEMKSLSRVLSDVHSAVSGNNQRRTPTRGWDIAQGIVRHLLHKEFAKQISNIENHGFKIEKTELGNRLKDAPMGLRLSVPRGYSLGDVYVIANIVAVPILKPKNIDKGSGLEISIPYAIGGVSFFDKKDDSLISIQKGVGFSNIDSVHGELIRVMHELREDIATGNNIKERIDGEKNSLFSVLKSIKGNRETVSTTNSESGVLLQDTKATGVGELYKEITELKNALESIHGQTENSIDRTDKLNALLEHGRFSPFGDISAYINEASIITEKRREEFIFQKKDNKGERNELNASLEKAIKTYGDTNQDKQTSWFVQKYINNIRTAQNIIDSHLNKQIKRGDKNLKNGYSNLQKVLVSSRNFTGFIARKNGGRQFLEPWYMSKDSGFDDIKFKINSTTETKDFSKDELVRLEGKIAIDVNSVLKNREESLNAYLVNLKKFSTIVSELPSIEKTTKVNSHVEDSGTSIDSLLKDTVNVVPAVIKETTFEDFFASSGNKKLADAERDIITDEKDLLEFNQPTSNTAKYMENKTPKILTDLEKYKQKAVKKNTSVKPQI